MRKYILTYLLFMILSLVNCAEPKNIKKDFTKNNQKNMINLKEPIIQTNLVLDLVKELNKIKNISPADLNKLDFQIIPDQEMLYIPTNLGILLTYNLEKKETKMIKNQETAKDLPQLGYSNMFSFNNNLVSDIGADRYSINATLFDKKTFKKTTTTYTHHFTDPMLVNQDRIYRIGTFYNVGDYGIEVFDKNLKGLWIYPDFSNGAKNIFPLENSFELDGNFHLFCGSDSTKSYLNHVVIQAETGKILLNEKLIDDIDEIWWDSTRSPGEIGKRVTQEGKDIFFEGQDKKGVYVAKFSIQENLTLSLQWKHYYTNYIFTDKLIPHKSNDIGLTILDDDPATILLPIWSQTIQDNVYSFDLYCLNKMDGSVKWKKKSITTEGELDIFSTTNGILIETDSKFVDDSFSHYLYALSPKNGEELWKRTINDKYYSDEIMNSSSICTQTAYYQFNQETSTLQKINLLDGQMTEKTFSQGKPLFGSFCKANDHSFLLLTNKNLINKVKTTTVLLYEVE